MKKSYAKMLINWLNKNQLDGGVFIDLWSMVALTQFAFGHHVDWGFVSVLGCYTAHTVSLNLKGGSNVSGTSGPVS